MDLDLRRIWDFRLGDMSSERSFSSLFEKSIDLGCSEFETSPRISSWSSPVVFQFHRRLLRVIQDCSSASFSCSTQKMFTCSSVMGLSNEESCRVMRLLVLLGCTLASIRTDWSLRFKSTRSTLLSYVSRSRGGRFSTFGRIMIGITSSGFCLDGFPWEFVGLFSGDTKSILLPLQNLVVRCGKISLVLDVRVSTCLARELGSFSRLSYLFPKVGNIFLMSLNGAVLVLALTA